MASDLAQWTAYWLAIFVSSFEWAMGFWPIHPVYLGILILVVTMAVVWTTGRNSEVPSLVIDFLRSLAVAIGAFILFVIFVGPFLHERDLTNYFSEWEKMRDKEILSQNAPQLSVSIHCIPELLPKAGRVGQKAFVLFLAPKWGDRLAMHAYEDKPSSPLDIQKGTGYQCQITNIGDTSLHGVRIPITVTYESTKTELKSRTAMPGLPIALEPNRPFIAYIVDDSGLSAHVSFPEQIEVRLSGDAKHHWIPVEYPSSNGVPLKLNGFQRQS